MALLDCNTSLVAFRINKSHGFSSRQDRSSPMKKNTFISLSAYFITMTYTVVSNSQVIGCEDRLQNDLYCVGWGVKLCSIQSNRLLRHMVCPTPCLLIGYSCLTHVVGVAYKNLFLKSDFFQMSRSGFDFGHEHFAQI